MAATDFVTEALLDALSAAIAARVNTLKAHDGDLASLTTTAKSSLVLAINEVAATASAGAGIDDGSTSGSTTWSSTKITAKLAALVDSAPGALDTLNELAAALGDDANFSSTITTALGLRLRVDAAQAFDSTQRAQGRANLGIVYSTQDFAGDFTTATA